MAARFAVVRFHSRIGVVRIPGTGRGGFRCISFAHFECGRKRKEEVPRLCSGFRTPLIYFTGQKEEHGLAPGSLTGDRTCSETHDAGFIRRSKVEGRKSKVELQISLTC